MPKAVRLPFATDWRCDRSVTDPGQSLPALNKASSRPAPTVVPNGKLVRTVAPCDSKTSSHPHTLCGCLRALEAWKRRRDRVTPRPI